MTCNRVVPVVTKAQGPRFGGMGRRVTWVSLPKLR